MSAPDSEVESSAVPPPAEVAPVSRNKFPWLLTALVGSLASLATLGIVVGSICGSGRCGSVNRSVESALASAEGSCVVIECHLRNLDTGEEISLQETDSFARQDNDDYSVRCVTSDDITYMDFFFDGDVQREFTKPFWMNSNFRNRILPVDYLSEECGQRSFTVSVATDEEGVCATNTYVLNADCDGSRR